MSEDVPFIVSAKYDCVTVTVYPTGHVHIEITPDPDEVTKEKINKRLQDYKGKIINSKEANEIAQLVNSLLR